RCGGRAPGRNRDRGRVAADAAEHGVAEGHRAVCPAARRGVRRLRPPAGTLAPEPAGAARNLPDAVAPSLETGAHGALILAALLLDLLRGHSTAGLGRVEAGLGRRPPVTLVLIARLAVRRLP